ncbi:MAG: hypothetical protein PHS14_08420 [Elusimicrobia bacterium]|nr:hypothetical protein [Elusimicrobiota bacterium]
MNIRRACLTLAWTGLLCLFGGARDYARAAEFEVTADSFTVANQINVSSVSYFQGKTSAPGDPAAATQLANPGGLYFDGTYYNVWDNNAGAWVQVATGTVEAGRVAKAGDFMSGQLTTASTITVQGDAFSVGGSTFVVTGGNVGMGTVAPSYAKLAISNAGDGLPALQLTTTGTKAVCAAAYRGALFVQQGGAGAADLLYVCLKTSADTYQWVLLTRGD